MLSCLGYMYLKRDTVCVDEVHADDGGGGNEA